MKSYIRCMRIPHYIKNLIIFLPVFFNQSITKRDSFFICVIGTIGFCFLSSAIYVLNDIQDIATTAKLI